jgi:hypothetical protein
VAREHVPMHSQAMQTPKSLAAPISPGDTFSLPQVPEGRQLFMFCTERKLVFW